MKKLPAFTLMEVLIGMIISSIVIGFGYATYSLIYKQYLDYKNVKEKVMEITQFNQVLATDISTAEVVSYNENTLTLYRKAQNNLQYYFYADLILRKENELMDTFRISPGHIKPDFLFDDNLMFVRQFSFDAAALGENEHFVFTKNYSSETLMNYEPLVKTQ